MRYMHIFLVMIQLNLRLEKSTADVTSLSFCMFRKNLYCLYWLVSVIYISFLKWYHLDTFIIIVISLKLPNLNADDFNKMYMLCL